MECISTFLVLAAKPTSLGTRVPKVFFFKFGRLKKFEVRATGRAGKRRGKKEGQNGRKEMVKVGSLSR